MYQKILPIAFLLFFAFPAYAETDVVYLKNGSRINGEVMEVIVDEYVSIQLADGRVKTFPWEEVERVEEAPVSSTAVPAATAVPVATPSASLSFTSSKRNIEIRHITSAGSAVAYGSNFQVASAYSQGWVPLCVTPCTVGLDPGHYQIQAAGANVTPGNIFVELSANDHLNYSVEPGGYLQMYGGVMLLTVGAMTGIMGGVYLLTMSDSDYRSAHRTMFLVGAPVGVLGWVVLKKNLTRITEQ